MRINRSLGLGAQATMKIIAWVFMPIGLLGLAAAIVTALLGLTTGNPDYYFGLFFGGFFFLIFFGMGFLFHRMGARGTHKRQRLMDNGYAYDAEIVNAMPNPRLQIKGQNPLVVECTYRDNLGQTCLVRSGNIYDIHPMAADQLRATVYVNPGDPRDYYVDVQQAYLADDRIRDLR